MLKFIVVENCEQTAKEIKSTINQAMMQNSINFSTFLISNSKDLESYMQDSDQKIYILDSRGLKNKSALSIAQEIRESDWFSYIIILSVFGTDKYSFLECRLMIFDYINLINENWTKNLHSDVMQIADWINRRGCLIIKHHYIDYCISFEDILYITIELGSRLTTIVTENEKIDCSVSLRQLESRLPSRFIRVYRSCIVNMDKIVKVDFKNHFLILKNKNRIWISRQYAKEIRNLLSEDCQNIEKII